MGWTYSSAWPNKASMVKYLTTEIMGPKIKTIAQASRGSTLWTVIEYIEDAGGFPAGTRAILCFLLGSDVKRCGGWGYKDMDESMGPVDDSCPVRYLDMVPDPGGYATEWRARVRAKAALRARKIAVGDHVTLRAGYNPRTFTVVSVKPLRGTAPNGVTYRVPRAAIETIENPTVVTA